MTESKNYDIEQILRDGMLLGESRKTAIDRVYALEIEILSKHKNVIHSKEFNDLLVNLIEIDMIKEKYPENGAPKVAYEHILGEAKSILPNDVYKVLVERGNLEFQRKKAEIMSQ